jgi:hypothetical protein
MLMTEEILMVVRIPISEIEEWMRSKYTLPESLSEFRVEENSLVLCFKERRSPEESANLSLERQRPKRRRSRRKRNRMKTRGWEIVDRMINSKGQKCSIYRPFVDALSDSSLTREEQKEVVKKILRSNKNKPSETSIQYFLENTLEYLENRRKSSKLEAGS